MTSFGAKLYANRGFDPLCCQFTAEFSVSKLILKKLNNIKPIGLLEEVSNSTNHQMRPKNDYNPEILGGVGF